MGCAAAKVDENIPDQKISTPSTPNIKKSKEAYIIKRGNEKAKSIEPYTKLEENQSELEALAKEELEIITQFNTQNKKKDTITLSSLSQYFLKSCKENTNIISLSTNEKIIKCLKNLNPFNENIDNNTDINLLKSELIKIETKHPKLIKPISPLFHLNLSQIIHQNYNFNFKLKNILTNKFTTFEFNTLDKPLLIIFFDILSLDAINKIKEFQKLEKELISNENKNFLLIPIMNVYVKEKENISDQKKYLESVNINDNCYILTQPINDNFIKLFELDCVTQSKVIIINRNSEISMICNDEIEFLTPEIIDFYLNTRNSEYKNDFFTVENKNEVTKILKNAEFQKIIENFREKFNLEIEFKEIENKKYPVNIRFMYHQKDSKNADIFINKLTSKINIKKYFISKNIIKDKKTELLKALDYMKEKIITSINKNININNSNFELFCQISNINTNNNDITKNKKYILKFYLSDLGNFNEVLNILSSNLYTNPQFSQLNCGYNIVPSPKLKMKNIINNCREIKLFTDKKSQMKFNNSNKDISFNLIQNKVEIIILLNPNIFLNNNVQKNKIKQIFDFLYVNKISFIIIICSFNELDAQKLRYLSWDKIFTLKKKSKKNKNDENDKKIEKKENDIVDINIDTLNLNTDNSEIENNKNYEKKKFKIIYLNSSLLQNYQSLAYYSEDITFKMIRINPENCEIINFYDLDNIDTYDFTDMNSFLNSIKNFNGNFNEDEIKTFKETKKNIFEIILKNKSKLKNFKCNNMNFSFAYDKSLLFENDSQFNNYKKYYANINVNVTYMDYVKNNIKFDKIKSLIDNHNKNVKIMNIKYNELELETINLFPKITKKFICSKCLKEKKFNNEQFYMCYLCKEEDFLLCRDCYDDLYFNTKTKQEDDDFFAQFIMEDPNQNVKDQDNSEKFYEKIHKHPLLFFFDFNSDKKNYMIKELYEKYLNILTENKKTSKSDIKICVICENYLFNDSKNISVVLSHIKNKTDYSQYSKPYDEIFICNECFQSNEYQNVLLKEETDNNFIILRLLNE